MKYSESRSRADCYGYCDWRGLVFGIGWSVIAPLASLTTNAELITLGLNCGRTGRGSRFFARE